MSNNVNTNVSGPGGYTWEVSESAPAAGVASPTSVKANADVVVSLSGERYLYVYDANPEAPKLPPVIEVTDADQYFAKGEVPEDLTTILEFEEDLQALVKNAKPPLTKSQIDRLRLKFRLGNDVKVKEPIIESEGAEVRAFMEKYAGEEHSPVSSKEYKNYLGAKYNGEFENQLNTYSKEHNLTEAQATEVKLAYHGIGGEQSVGVAKTLEAQGIQTVNENLGVPGDKPIVPKSSQSFIEEVDYEYTEAFLTLSENYNGQDLNTYAKNQNISIEEARERLAFLFNDPTANYPNKAVLVGITENLKTQAKQNSGFPGLNLEVDTKPHFSVIQGAYQEEFLNLVNADTTLSNNEKTNLIATWRSGEANWDTKIQGLSQKAITTITPLYGLPVGYVPSSQPLTGGRIEGAEATRQLEAIQQVRLNLDKIIEMARALPLNDEDRMLLNDFIKMISDALQELKESLFRMQAGDSKKARDLGASRVQMAEEKFKTMQKERLAQEAEVEKQKEQQFISDILSGVMMGLTVIALTLTMGPVGLAIGIGLVLATYVPKAFGEEKNAIALMFEGIDNGTVVAGISDAIGIPKETVAVILKVVLIVILVGVAIYTGGGAMGAILAACLLAESKTISFVINAALIAIFPDMDPNTAMMIASIAEMLIILAITVAILKSARTDGRFFKNSFAENLQKDTTIKWLKRLTTVGQLSTSSAQAFIDAEMSFSLARLAEIEGEYESKIARLEAMIKALQKLIDNFLEALSGRGEFIEQVGKTQSNMWKGLHDAGEVANSAILRQ